MKKAVLIAVLSMAITTVVAQNNQQDSAQNWYTIHGQTTVITQSELAFNVKYQ